MATPNHYAADMLLLRGLSTVPKPETPNTGSRTHAAGRAAGRAHERMLSGAWLEVRSWKVRAIDERLPVLGSKWERAEQAILCASGQLAESASGNFTAAEWSSDELRLLESVLKETRGSLTKARTLPQVEIAGAQRVPRAYAAGEAFLRAVKNEITIEPLVTFLRRAQEHFPFRMAELWNLKAFMELALLEQIAEKLEYSESGLHVRARWDDSHWTARGTRHFGFDPLDSPAWLAGLADAL